MRKLLFIILFICASSSLQLMAQVEIAYFDKNFKIVNREKKASYISKNQFNRKGEEKLLLLAIDGAEKVFAVFIDGKFKRVEPFNEEEVKNRTSIKSYKDVNELDIEPRPIGGWNSLQKFILENSSLSTLGEDAELSKRVYVEFFVTKEGGVSDVKVLKGTISDENLEAVRLIKEFGEKVGWEPGILHGKPEITRLIMPFVFVRN